MMQDLKTSETKQPTASFLNVLINSTSMEEHTVHEISVLIAYMRKNF